MNNHDNNTHFTCTETMKLDRNSLHVLCVAHKCETSMESYLNIQWSCWRTCRSLFSHKNKDYSDTRINN